MLPSLLLALVGLFASALAEINIGELVAQLPACTVTCSAELLAVAQCPLTDIQNCLCTNTTLQNELFVCVQQSCNLTEQSISATTSQSICKGVPQPSRSTEIIRVVIIISVFAFPIIGLRLLSRYIVSRISWDDWVVVTAAICMVPMTVIPIFNATKGFGTHAWDVPPQNATLLRQLYYVSQILYVIVQNLAKVSILLLYLRIFPDERFRLYTKLAMYWIALRAFAFLIAVSLQCLPVRALWDLSVPAKCINPTAITAAGAAFSILEDIVIILMPIPELKALNLSLRKRIVLILMFGLGSFACITSMVRLKFIVKFTLNSLDATWDNVDVVIWSIIEVYTAMICTCLMAIRPLLVKYLPSFFPTTTASSSNQHASTSWRPRESKFWGSSKNTNALELASKENVFAGGEEERGLQKNQTVKITREFHVSESHLESENTSASASASETDVVLGNRVTAS